MVCQGEEAKFCATPWGQIYAKKMEHTVLLIMSEHLNVLFKIITSPKPNNPQSSQIPSLEHEFILAG